MRKLFLFFVVTAITFSSFAQQTVSELRETANTFMRQGDHDNAILVLNKALQTEPDNFAILQDLALNYYFSKNFDKALQTIKPLLDRTEANDQTFQIAGNVLKLKKDAKEAEKVYTKGLKKFPDSGALFNDYGSLLWMMTKPNDAIKQFEEGIKRDPNFSGNYLNAAYYYAEKDNIIWPLLYGEMYVNLNPNGTETPGVKQMLYNAYKKFFTQLSEGKNPSANEASDFGKLALATLEKQSAVTAMGLDPETLTMIRTRFILDWYNDSSNLRYPFKLFDMHQQLLRDGLFQPYNQWMFGPIQNLETYKAWIDGNKEAYDKFILLQKQRLFKVPKGQYYYR